MSTPRDRITVLVPAYQHERYIGECLEAIRAQLVDADLTVLIGEDGSTDGTLRICRHHAAEDPRIVLIERPPHQRKIRIEGHLTGRANLLDLMARADGDYVIRIDGDDKWSDPRKLQAQLDALRRAPRAVGCYHHAQRIDGEGRSLGALFNKDLPERFDLEGTITHRSPFHISSFLYRNLPVLRHPPALARRAGSLDLLLFALAASKGPLIRVEGAMTCYRVNEQGLSQRGLYARSNDLRLRILLWTALVAVLHGRGREKALAICDDLLRAALAHPVTARDAKAWALAVVRRPGYFLARRWRMGQVARLVRKGLRA